MQSLFDDGFISGISVTSALEFVVRRLLYMRNRARENPCPYRPSTCTVAMKDCFGTFWQYAGLCTNTTRSMRTRKPRLVFCRLCAGTQQYATVAQGGSCSGAREERRGPAGANGESPGAGRQGSSQGPPPAPKRAGKKSSQASPGPLQVLCCAAWQQIFVRSEIEDLKRWRDNANENRVKKRADLKARAKEDEAVQS